MLTTFQKALLATVAASALLISLGLALRGPALATAPLAATISMLSANGGIAAGVVTVGDATMKVRPDIAILTVGATAQAATAAEAQRLVAERIDRILAQARAIGIADKDTKTASYHIEPRYVYDKGGEQPPRIAGYQAAQMLALTLRTVEVAGGALDALVQNDGATNASVRFALDDPKTAQADGRRLAVEDARAKADAMARTAGARLGKVVAISDVTTPSIRYAEQIQRGAAAPAPTQIPVGDLEIVVRVQVQFAIE